MPLEGVAEFAGEKLEAMGASLIASGEAFNIEHGNPKEVYMVTLREKVGMQLKKAGDALMHFANKRMEDGR